MPNLWMPGAERRPISNTGTMNGGPSRVIWHATSNAKTDGFSNHVGWFTGGGSGSAPHILWHPYTGQIAQFFPADSRSLSVRNAGSVQTNRTGAYCIQVEVCFTKDLRAGVTHISQTPCKNLDQIMSWLHSLGIKDAWPGGEPTGWVRDTVSIDTWLNKGGHYGHNQVPGNDHIDPGKLPDLFHVTPPVPETGLYTVKSGDTLWGISHEFGVAVTDLKDWNDLDSNLISIGQVLRVEPPKAPTPKTYTVVPGDTLWALSRHFDITVRQLKEQNHLNSDDLSIGQVLYITGVAPETKPEPKPKPKPEIRDAGGWLWFDNVYPDGKESNSTLIVQRALKFEFPDFDYSTGPGEFGPRTTEYYAKWQRKLGYSGSDADGLPGKSSLEALAKKYKFEVRYRDTKVKSPVPGRNITFPYGAAGNYAAGYHTGADWAAPQGARIVAVRDGTIVWANGNGGAYGNWIGLRADNGRDYVYCHLSRFAVGAGTKVKAGDTIGYVGSSGNTTGPHLHFEDRPHRGGYGNVRKPRW